MTLSELLKLRLDPTLYDRLTWWDMRFPWEEPPPRWRIWKRAEWWARHRRIAALERIVLGIEKPFGHFPWETWTGHY